MSPAFSPLLLVSPTHPLPPGYAPCLTPVDEAHPRLLLERRTARLLEACLRAVGGLEQIVPVSGWRSQAEQQQIWDDCWAREGEVFTRSYVAPPGCSEHQTGLAIDLGLAAPHIDFIRPHFPDQGVCRAFRLLAPHYGFVLRYPAGRHAVTSIAHEPWHFRYVGIPHARIITDRNLVLEEYLALLREQHPPVSPLQVRLDGMRFRIYALPRDRTPAPSPWPEGCRTVSEDNCGYQIITDWIREE